MSVVAVPIVVDRVRAREIDESVEGHRGHAHTGVHLGHNAISHDAHHNRQYHNDVAIPQPLQRSNDNLAERDDREIGALVGDKARDVLKRAPAVVGCSRSRSRLPPPESIHTTRILEPKIT